MSRWVDKWEFKDPVPDFWQERLDSRNMSLYLGFNIDYMVSEVTISEKFRESGWHRAMLSTDKSYMTFDDFYCLVHIAEGGHEQVGTPRPEAPKEDEDVGARQPGDPEEGGGECDHLCGRTRQYGKTQGWTSVDWGGGRGA